MRHREAGIRDVLYYFYSHVPEGTLIGGWHPNEILDYALPKARAACDVAMTDCSAQPEASGCGQP